MNWQDLNSNWLLAAVLVAVLALVLAIVWRWLRRARQPRERMRMERAIDISQLDDAGPPDAGPRMEFYGTPVRLAVLVVAPGGRGGELPPPEVLPGLLERLVPGMTDVIARHKPLIARWSPQLSSQGFAQSFFNLAALPGARGKGTSWCSIAGRLSVGERAFLVGLVCCADRPNALSQVVVQHEGQWLDILRIRNE